MKMKITTLNRARDILELRELVKVYGDGCGFGALGGHWFSDKLIFELAEEFPHLIYISPSKKLYVEPTKIAHQKSINKIEERDLSVSELYDSIFLGRTIEERGLLASKLYDSLFSK
ncbi:hypothetical protein bcgnr5378_06430 [Bacillus cereus]|nr:hypothetical protein [Bacillus cereus]